MNVTEIVYSVGTTNFGFYCSVLLIVFGILGNLVNIAALLRSRVLRKRMTTVFIVSLSVTDLMFCGFNLPLTATRFYHRAWVMGEAWCKVFPFVLYLNVAASLYHIMSISINRCILIVMYPIYAKVYKPVTVAMNIAICWAVPLILLIPTLFGKWGMFGHNPKTFSCTILEVDGMSPKKALLYIGVIPPTITTIACYLAIYLKFRKSRESVVGKKKQVDIALTKVVLVIFCAFFLCYGPLLLVNVFDKNEKKVPWLHVVASVFAWSSSVINPIIYAGLNSQYRKAYVRLLPQRFRGWMSEISLTRSSDLSTITAKSYNMPNVKDVPKEQNEHIEKSSGV